ncbi:hypothetical protein GCM10007868_09040 [Gluconobacter frateurii]|uniref:Flagellar assembly protein FliH/Type III secretion system HrpE domain-containing protein n=2 Tax=Gluconobacter frateurii TaxID=38308 RepID=A0ABQ0QCR8_9PROT|nr:hypothetical protein AA0228_1977 [Gluconobacter frateurii NRIC 0228]GLP89829.1 hypothetical protein GCM10007868_09040 [Gluconobacter frateurii]
MTAMNYERSDRVAGVLYAEDFDFPASEDVSLPAHEETQKEPEVLVPSYTEEDLENARRAGEEKGRLEERRDFALEKEEWINGVEQKVLDLINELNEQFENVLRNVSEEAASVLLSQVAALFPSLLQSTGKKERDAVLDKILSSLKRVVCLRIEAPEQEINYLSTLCAQAGVIKMDCHVNDALAPGDFRFSWPEGQAFRNAGSIAQDIMRNFECIN